MISFKIILLVLCELILESLFTLQCGCGEGCDSARREEGGARTGESRQGGIRTECDIPKIQYAHRNPEPKSCIDMRIKNENNYTSIK